MGTFGNNAAIGVMALGDRAMTGRCSAEFRVFESPRQVAIGARRLIPGSDYPKK
jgi:hypothetical protein